MKKPVICVGNEQLHSIAATECYILLRTRNSGKTLEMASRNSDTKIKEFLQKAKKIFPEVKTQIHSVCTGLKKGSSNRERSSFLPCSEKVLLITLPINEQKVPALLDLARQCKLAPLEGRSAFQQQ